MKANKRIRVITVGQVKENENMSKLAKLMLGIVNESEYGYLHLYVFDDFIDRPLDDILEQGMYKYVCRIDWIIELLNQLDDAARPVMFSKEDIFTDNTFIPTF